MFGLKSGTRMPSWEDTATKRDIIDFVSRVTKRGNAEFVPPEGRVAVFDNDGTLWCEKPLPIQADFLLRRVAAMAEKDPSLRGEQPWKAVVTKDHAWLSNVITNHYRGDDTDLKILGRALLLAYEGATIEEFEAEASHYLRTEQHPTLKRPYVECVYQPMVELLHYLADHGFTSYIASASGRDFMRPVTLDVYGIPPERVIGSTAALEYSDRGEFAEILHKPELDLFDDGLAKPVRIWSRIGRRPIFVAGNSNGDIPMLRFAAQPSHPWLSVLLHHDDDSREYAYDAGSEKALELAGSHDFLVVSMKSDWKSIFPH